MEDSGRLNVNNADAGVRRKLLEDATIDVMKHGNFFLRVQDVKGVAFHSPKLYICGDRAVLRINRFDYAKVDVPKKYAKALRGQRRLAFYFVDDDEEESPDTVEVERLLCFPDYLEALLAPQADEAEEPAADTDNLSEGPTRFQDSSEPAADTDNLPEEWPGNEPEDEAEEESLDEDEADHPLLEMVCGAMEASAKCEALRAGVEAWADEVGGKVLCEGDAAVIGEAVFVVSTPKGVLLLAAFESVFGRVATWRTNEKHWFHVIPQWRIHNMPDMDTGYVAIDSPIALLQSAQWHLEPARTAVFAETAVLFDDRVVLNAPEAFLADCKERNLSVCYLSQPPKGFLSLRTWYDQLPSEPFSGDPALLRQVQRRMKTFDFTRSSKQMARSAEAFVKVELFRLAERIVLGVYEKRGKVFCLTYDKVHIVLEPMRDGVAHPDPGEMARMAEALAEVIGKKEDVCSLSRIAMFPAAPHEMRRVVAEANRLFSRRVVGTESYSYDSHLEAKLIRVLEGLETFFPKPFGALALRGFGLSDAKYWAFALGEKKKAIVLQAPDVNAWHHGLEGDMIAYLRDVERDCRARFPEDWAVELMVVLSQYANPPDVVPELPGVSFVSVQNLKFELLRCLFDALDAH